MSETEIVAKDGKKKYWAAEKDLKKLVSSLEERVRRYYEWIESSGNMKLWRNSHKASYQGLRSRGQLGKDGENLEYTTLAINHYGNLKQHILTMVTGQRQYFESKASNTDHRSQAQTLVANSLIETVMREKDLERISQRATGLMLEAGEGFVLKMWDWEAGPEVAVDQQEQPADPLMQQLALLTSQPEPEPVTRKSGDVRFSVHHPIDVVRDVIRSCHEDQDWYIVRTYRNRYDLAVEFPKVAKEILKAPTIQEMETDHPRLVTTTDFANWECDQVAVWLFIHKKTPALPEGRIVPFVSKEAALYDDPMTYREMPLYRISAQDIEGIPMGYSTMFDLLAPQQALNATVSTVTSNLAAFGVQNIWVPEGAKLTVEQLKSGLKMISGGTEKPESLNLFSLPQEVIKFLDMLERWLETLSGINSVARGNPEASLKSGSALALVQAQALQFVALWQKAYIKYLENVASGVVYDFQDFGEVPHIITITGKANKQYIAEFTSANIDRISRVQVQVGNPLSGTIAGRVNMIEQLGNLGLIKTPEQYMQVLTTGRLEPATEGTMAELMLIKSENERLAEGVYTQAIILENHPLHLKEHYFVLSSPEARQNPAVVDATLQHMQEHITLWTQANPMLLMVLGIQPPMDPNMMAGMGGGPQGGGMNPSPEAMSGQQPQPGPIGIPGMDNSLGVTKMPKQPNMPRNAATGERVAAPTNGAPSSPIPQ